MASQCRHDYGVTIWESEYDEMHCPNLIRGDSNETVPVQLFNGGKTHDTLLDSYNYWYQQWKDERKKFPHLAIRYEDLLFHGREVIQSACDCIVGNLTSDFKYESENAKDTSDGNESNMGASGLVTALIRYGDPIKRLNGFTVRDLSYARGNNATVKLMEEYQYSFPAFN